MTDSTNAVLDATITPTAQDTTQTTTTVSKEETDWEKKAKASAAEAQILNQKLKEKDQLIEQMKAPKEPSEDDLKNEYPDWETWDDSQKKLAKDNFILRNQVQSFSANLTEFSNDRRWVEKIENFLEENKVMESFKELVGHEDEFKMYATKPTRKGVDLTTIAFAFIGEKGLTVPEHKPEPKPQSNSLLETTKGGGERQTTNNSGKLSTAELEKLRKNDQKAWQREIMKPIYRE